MLPTLVIGLREGLEAALIIGIIAAFLRQQGRRDLLRWMAAGVSAAVLLCVGVGVALDVVSHDLPQKQQEGLETVIGALAVAMVTYMVVWMRRHSRDLKGSLESAASAAMETGATDADRGAKAMVLMAFLAVLREGFETVVFLIATFNESGSGTAPVVGAVLGIVIAAGAGYGIYRGGIRINLSRFFRATGLVLVLVAAGLVATAFHTAHEAGWLDAGQGSTVDLSGLVRPGSVQSALLTGILGIQPHPVVIEVLGWLAYVVPIGIYVAWPHRAALTGLRARVIAITSAALVAVLGVSAATAAVTRAGDPVTDSDESDAPAGHAVSALVARTHRVHVTITEADGCAPSATALPAGALTFVVTNKDATGVSEVEVLSGERIVGEKENLPAGFGGSFAVNLDAGSYRLYCPGAATETVPLTVTGTATPAGSSSVVALLATGTKDYAGYVRAQAGHLVDSVEALRAAIRSRHLAAAQAAYAKARPFYETIEPVAESFTVGSNNLDADIDARAGDVPAARWRGFHRIEQGLFEDRSTSGLTPYADTLVADVTKLRRLTRTLTYQAFELANGAQELLDEVARSKVTGEEERYSHFDLLDIDSNDEGAAQAFTDLEPAIAVIDRPLANTISARFSALERLVDSFHTTSNPSGFARYDALSAIDKHRVAAAVKAVQEPLSQVGSKVASS